MTNFDELAEFGGPRMQAAIFNVAGVGYGVYFTEITEFNPYDCAVEFPQGFTFPEYGNHYDVVFDSLQNRKEKTFFKRMENLPDGAGTRVLKCVERIIIDHYNTFNVALYTFAPEDLKLSGVYCRFVAMKKHRGSTIEVGLEPGGRANVLRTPKFYTA
ncbi:hypothetical protein HG548_22300 [Citrobacter sp. DNRA3]|uniref:hypothetical protein n=1 Tax=Citrobacter sp. DNRA3 TaxID=2723054 RepID=UPI0014596E33|nr:hypothetical protein [Citrobacter sp. DNRA3]NBJ31821.1 hypothetical protein [Citrobacter freundii]NMD77250.1 hypothetical protein [Citrobacter sp. DNRA3]